MLEPRMLFAGAAALTALTAAVLSARRRYVVVVVRGQSMRPTLANGDRLLVRRTSPERFKVGQIIVFEAPGVRLEGDPAWRIKRVAAVAGDPGFDGGTVPPGRVVVCGDNERSATSEQLGYVAVESVLGTADPRFRLTSG